ncbi:hypothetical protein K3495_g17037 [Podosphaera aphanis]|nr:hypothetical protein K3495_g17037 [Podosphaera aphanis]
MVVYSEPSGNRQNSLKGSEEKVVAIVVSSKVVLPKFADLLQRIGPRL